MSLDQAVNPSIVHALLDVLFPAFLGGILLGVALTMFGSRNVERQARF